MAEAARRRPVIGTPRRGVSLILRDTPHASAIWSIVIGVPGARWSLGTQLCQTP
jgi:hypothetical protein